MTRAEAENTVAADREYSWTHWVGEPEPSVEAAKHHPFGAFSARYQVINELGRGSMGVVSRALDRLTGRIVTAKRLRAADDKREGSLQVRAQLAQEFQLLASVHHPNIISVLDYGFDDDRQPYLIMDLEENAQTILEAGADEPLSVRIDLLAQLLRALVYLHRLGIIHRDLKPDNILVVRSQVKLLDFGLSCDRETLKLGAAGWAGTLAYMAPEILRGGPPSERSDLYAVGVVAYELFTGAYPFEDSDPVELYEAVMGTPLPRPTDDIDPRLRPVLEQLLAKDPDDRFEDAGATISALSSAVGGALSIETATTRESFIQSAPFVGRHDELASLREALTEAVAGKGSAWLVGGASGVGKSRLLDELRTYALVEGVTVLRGHAVSRGGGPYHVWREIVSSLLLGLEVTDAGGEVLKAIVPNIGALLGRPIGDPPAVEPESALHRLLFAVEGVFRAQTAPLLVIVEDLHWAGSESRRLFAWLTQPLERLPVLLVGSFRDDEARDLVDDIKEARLLHVDRLSPSDVTVLGEAMIGRAARRPDIVDLLEREAEGIPFFIVEVVRALAESAGRLDRIGDEQLPQRVLAGGVEKVTRRRLNQVPADAMAPLITAAFVGRNVDLPIMRHLHPTLDVEGWAMSCARASVLEFREQRWRFAHDKLREHLIEHTPEGAARDLHRQVAGAIEAVYTAKSEFVPALAHHWRAAGEPTREVEYARRAGVMALQSGACREAVEYLSRARDLLRAGAPAIAPVRARRGLVERLDPNTKVDTDGPQFALGLVESGLSEAYYRLGFLKECREHSERALVCFGQSVPSSKAGWVGAAASEFVLRCLQVLFRARGRDGEHVRRVAAEIARVQLRLTDTLFYALELPPLLWSSLRVVNQCEPAGPLPELAQGHIIMALLAHTAGMRRLAESWARRALAIAESTAEERNVAWVLSRVGVMQIGDCQWDAARAGNVRATEIAERLGDVRLWEETRMMAGMMALFAGRFDESLACCSEALRLSRRSGNRQIECWSLLGIGGLQMRLGRSTESIGNLEAALVLINEDELKTEALIGFGALSLTRLRTGDLEAAYQSADRALRLLRTVEPVVYWLQVGLGAMAEVFLTLLEAGWAPDQATRRDVLDGSRQAVAGVRRFAKYFRLGEPQAWLWQGLAAQLEGRQERAMRLWKRAIVVADELETPYEGARAHLEIGRHLPPGVHDREHHLRQAEALFERLGCVVELQRTRAELNHCMEAPAHA